MSPSYSSTAHRNPRVKAKKLIINAEPRGTGVDMDDERVSEILAGEGGGVKRFEGGISARRLLDFFPGIIQKLAYNYRY